jgi:hypothetical protein
MTSWNDIREAVYTFASAAVAEIRAERSPP